MEPMPQTRTSRKAVAQGMRNDLATYKSQVDDQSDRLLYRTCKDLGQLVRLEGLDWSEAQREFAKGYLGR